MSNLIGNVLTVHGRATFTSKRSMEIEIVVFVESLFEKELKFVKAIDSFFTYVSIGRDGSVLDIPPLKVANWISLVCYSFINLNGFT